MAISRCQWCAVPASPPNSPFDWSTSIIQLFLRLLLENWLILYYIDMDTNIEIFACLFSAETDQLLFFFPNDQPCSCVWSVFSTTAVELCSPFTCRFLFVAMNECERTSKCEKEIYICRRHSAFSSSSSRVLNDQVNVLNVQIEWSIGWLVREMILHNVHVISRNALPIRVQRYLSTVF